MIVYKIVRSEKRKSEVMKKVPNHGWIINITTTLISHLCVAWLINVTIAKIERSGSKLDNNSSNYPRNIFCLVCCMIQLYAFTYDVHQQHIVKSKLKMMNDLDKAFACHRILLCKPCLAIHFISINRSLFDVQLARFYVWI